MTVGRMCRGDLQNQSWYAEREMFTVIVLVTELESFNESSSWQV